MEEKRKRAQGKGKLKRKVIYVYEDEEGKEYREEVEEEYDPKQELPESKRMKSEGRLVSRQYKNLAEEAYTQQPINTGMMIRS